MSKKYYITYLSESVNEGGMARNRAFADKILSSNSKMLNMYLYKNNIFKRIYKSICFFAFFLFKKQKSIFFHQFAFALIFPFISKKISQYFYKIAIHSIAKKNKIHIEINDLRYEQAIDLELPVTLSMLEFEDFIFTIPNCYYIFASHAMSDYVCEKYNIDSSYSQVVINGGPHLQSLPLILTDQKWTNSSKTKYVYAGSLNKGRQIENLIDIFKIDSNNLLILIGIWGEWLLTIDLPPNIIYLGDFKENVAQYIVSACDVGLIPYAEDRFYYNLCYPTKASFYITAGIPFLSTPLVELQNVFEDGEMCYFESFSKWQEFLKKIDKNSLEEVKKKINIEKQKFYWDYLIDTHFEFK